MPEPEIPTQQTTTPVQPNFMPQRGGGGPGGFNRRFMTEKPKLKNVKGTVRRLSAYLLKKWHMLTIVFLCSLVTTIVTIVATRLNGYTIDVSIAARDLSGLLRVCFVMVGIYIVGSVSTYTQNILMIRVAQRSCADIRRDLFARLQGLPLRYFDTHSSGDLMSRLTNDVDNINTTMSQAVVQMFTSIISITGTLVAMLILSPVLSLAALLTTSITFVVSRVIVKVAQPCFVIQQRELGKLNGYIEEMLSGQKVVKLFSREGTVQAEMEAINGRMIQSAFKAQAISGIMGPSNNMVNNIAYLLVSVAGGAFVISGFGAITVGVVFSFLLYMRNFSQPINQIMNLFNTIQLALAGAERVFEVMDEPVERDSGGALPAGGIKGDIRMENIRFSYIEGKPVLNGATITAKPGQTVAIVGPTGAGKTTIINLLTRFYDVDSGEISIDGRSIDSFTRGSLRQSISMVLQDTFLFSDTIRENIRYGRAAAADGEVEQAARQAHAHEFIVQLPNGYDTVLEDNGVNLSQGQRQLLSIARAIISNASVLILDEATSCIDTRTELLIQNALLHLMRGKTSFVIAHRLSTIKNADNILVVNNGQVIEQGTHTQLINAGGFYAHLYNSQFKTGMPV